MIKQSYKYERTLKEIPESERIDLGSYQQYDNEFGVIVKGSDGFVCQNHGNTFSLQTDGKLAPLGRGNGKTSTGKRQVHVRYRDENGKYKSHTTSIDSLVVQCFMDHNAPVNKAGNCCIWHQGGAFDNNDVEILYPCDRTTMTGLNSLLKAGHPDTEEAIINCIEGGKHFLPKYLNFGYLGELGPNVDFNSPSWRHWWNMLYRCRGKVNPYYSDVTICAEWGNYSNFDTWHLDNYYEVEGELMALDKDILYPGNRIYSPERCLYVPVSINGYFTGQNKNISPEGIRELAEKYYGKISAKVYDALLRRAALLET